MATDTLASLARELEAMPASVRRAILHALTPAERAALDRQLGESTREAPRDVQAHSPWLAERIDAVRHGSGHAPGTMTSASRQTLLRSIDPVPITTQRGNMPANSVPGRSLLGAVSGLLMPKTR